MVVVVPVVLLLLSMRLHGAQSTKAIAYNSESADFTSRAFKANISIRDFCALTQLFAYKFYLQSGLNKIKFV